MSGSMMAVFFNPDFNGTLQEAETGEPMTFADAEGNVAIVRDADMPNEWFPANWRQTNPNG